MDALMTLFSNIAKAIRFHTNETALIKPIDFPDKIMLITNGSGPGGSCDDVRYVTFMSYDGAIEYGKKAVAVGDDCANPIARNIFKEPTKESSVQYDYIFEGWATTPNGEADENWNKEIEEDKTVYADFAPELRYYTVTFYDEDGITILDTKSVAYGSVPSYTPTKDGYDFVEWNPAPVAVTGEASYTAVWKLKASFTTASWAEIAEICNSGRASEVFNIGDYKPVTLTYDNGISETINFRIVDMGVDSISKTEKASLTIMADNIVAISPTCLSSKYNNHKSIFYKNDLAANFLEQVFNALPEDLQNVIKPYCFIDYFSETYTNIFVAHAANLGIKHTDFGNPDTPQYNSVYKYFADGASILRTKLADTTADNYWTSARVQYSDQGSYTSQKFLAIDGEQRINQSQSASSASHGIVPCFCI